MIRADLAAVLFDLDGTLVGRNVEDGAGPAEAVKAIAQRYRVGIVSDGGSDSQRTKLALTGLTEVMSVVVISGEVRAQKPSRKIFEHAVRKLGCPARALLFVGDDLRRDVDGARGAGLMTCWVAKGRSLPPGRTPPDVVVANIVELREVLAC